jgi:hypothetical protein
MQLRARATMYILVAMKKIAAYSILLVHDCRFKIARTNKKHTHIQFLGT